MGSVYEGAGGAEGMRRPARAWHERVLADEVVSHAFSHGFRPDRTERLAAYLGESLGGPPACSARFGDQTAVVRLHSGMGAPDDMDQCAIACFRDALADVGLAADERLSGTLVAHFTWATTVAMAQYPHTADDVPDGQTIPRWSWLGLED